VSETSLRQPPAFRPSLEFLARAKRMDDAMHIRKPDRVPVAPLVVTYYATKIKGISNRDAMYMPEKTAQAWKDAAIRHNWDSAAPWGTLLPAPPLELLGMTQIKWPGGGLSDDQPYQFVEGEYMKREEYDEILADPNGFAVKKLWPRVSTVLAAITGMAQTPPPPLSFVSNAYALPAVIGEILTAPPMKELLRRLLELEEFQERFSKVAAGYAAEIMDQGFPVAFSVQIVPAFDMISDMLRGMKGAMLDMYQAPDKLIALTEMFTPLTISLPVATAQQTGGKGVFIPMHRGAAGFMSDRQFAKFYWPCFKTLLLGLVDAGLTPIPLFEGDYTPRLEYLTELPPGRIVAHFDRVDRKKAKKLLGDVMCFWGNVPASLLVTGTVPQVKDDVKELIDTFGDNGGLIIDATVGIPDEAKEENVQAMTEAVHEHGVF
jgi:uroporphyrinogen-III decarboxylase